MNMQLILFMLMCFIWYNVYHAAHPSNQDENSSRCAHLKATLLSLVAFNLLLLLSTKGDFIYGFDLIVGIAAANLLLVSPAIVVAVFTMWDNKLDSFQRNTRDRYIAFLLVFGWVPLWLLFVLFAD